MKSKLFRKLVVIILCVAICYSYFFGNIFLVMAGSSYLGRVTTDLNFRSKPTTANNADGSTNVIGEIDSGTLVNVLDSTKISGSGCGAGWLLVSYNGSNGYLCSSFVSDATLDTYDRPWNTPKKAIVGGAKWISNGYISKGQFTSYLKKYNVNPNGSNGVSGMFNHQYMSNLAAPSSEAATSYYAYKANGLLDLPLIFNIPIYDNMADIYNRPGGDLDTISKTDTVSDQDFEEQLNKQSFPESYKRYLRVLHSIHPNWSFVGMITGVDYTYAVNVEKGVGAIQGNSLYYELVNGEAVKTEPGWYLPNFATTAYYMDPRNFLNEKYILQFESLEYSSNYNENVVQSILNNTFMSGNSEKDNQSYKSIFVEAGLKGNVSPVYLASLARQESGNNGSLATSGNDVEYNGITYSSLYNFFNIGANSSASNPIKQGIVYASGGYCQACGNYDNSDKEVIKPVDNIVSASTSINNLGIKLSNSYLNGFNIGTDVGNLKAIDNNVNFSGSGNIATGMVLTFADGKSYTAVVYGDISGDGVINSADLLKLRQYLLGTIKLDGAYLEAAHTASGTSVNSADLLKMRQYLLGTASINQV